MHSISWLGYAFSPAGCSASEIMDKKSRLYYEREEKRMCFFDEWCAIIACVAEKSTIVGLL